MRFLAALALLASTILLAFDRLDRPGGDFSLEEARAFDEFPLYYAGEKVEGLPLTAVLRRDDDAEYVSFVYGDCTASSDGGCAPPAEVQVWPGGRRNAGSYDPSAPGAPVPVRASIRGRPAASFAHGTQLEIYAGSSTVVVFAHTREHALAVASALRCLGRAGDGPAAGTLEC